MNDPDFRRRGEPDGPSGDWPVAVSLVALFALIGFIVWVYHR